MAFNEATAFMTIILEWSINNHADYEQNVLRMQLNFGRYACYKRNNFEIALGNEIL